MAKLPGEFELIRRLAARVGPPGEPGVVGIGDDAAAVPCGEGWLLLTCDIAVEGRHFRLEHSPLADVGWKVATANVSDIAACGGAPGHALISLGLPPYVETEQLDALYDGLAEAARAYGFSIVGGNVSGARELIVDAFFTGTTTRFVPRGGARPGDRVALSGPVGDSAAGLEVLLAGEPADEAQAALRARHLRPRARTDLAERLRAGAHAAIDLSDGLSSELNHLAEASGARLEVAPERIPISAELAAFAAARGEPSLRWALHGGEDYQILATYPPERDALFAGAGMTVIGEVVTGQGVTLGGEPLLPGGWNHLGHQPARSGRGARPPRRRVRS